MDVKFIVRLVVAGLVSLGLTAPQLAFAAPSPAGVSTGTEASNPLVTQVKKKGGKGWKGKGWKGKKWKGSKPKHWRGYRAPRGAYVRGWNRRPYYGTAMAGVVLGTVIAAAAAPRAPADNLCWYWTNPARTHGYWDYCY